MKLFGGYEPKIIDLPMDNPEDSGLITKGTEVADLENLKEVAKTNRAPIYRMKSQFGVSKKVVSENEYEMFVDLFNLYFVRIDKHKTITYHFFKELVNSKPLPRVCVYCGRVLETSEGVAYASVKDNDIFWVHKYCGDEVIKKVSMLPEAQGKSVEEKIELIIEKIKKGKGPTASVL